MTQENITKHYFSQFHNITDNNGHPLTNVYWSYAPRKMPTYGSIYLIHGYGGSPVEPCLKLPMMQALAAGFDVVALEGVDLSATAGESKEIGTMTLERQKQALYAGLNFARIIPNLNSAHRIAWVHSISCRALADLMVDHYEMRGYFSEVVLNNPYFLAPPKVQKLHDRLMSKDPSGKSWADLTQKAQNMERRIENQTFKIPTCLYNLCIPLPPLWQKFANNFKFLGRIMAHFVSKTNMYFILGTKDDMADYNQNLELFQDLSVPNKRLVSIEGANHSFENELSQYQKFVKIIIDSIRLKTQKDK